MKKKIIKIVLIIIAIIALIILGVLINIKLSEKNPSITGKSYRVGVKNIPIEDREKLITNYQEFIQYFEKCGIETSRSNLEIFNLYNEEFFNNKKLAILYEEFGSGAYSVEYRECEIKDEVAYIQYEDIIPEGDVTMDMSGVFVIVELPKEVTSMVTEKIYKNK